MQITFHGHSCIQVETQTHSLIIDFFNRESNRQDQTRGCKSRLYPTHSWSQ